MSITPPKPHDELAAVAARLSRAAPNTWEEFVRAFNTYGGVRMAACVQSPPDKILVAQGKAQQCAELSDMFTNAIATANKLAQQK